MRSLPQCGKIKLYIGFSKQHPRLKGGDCFLFFFFFFFDAFSERLKLAMKKMDMSPRDLAMLSDVSTVTAQRWLRGTYEPRHANLTKIAHALNVSPNYLCCFVD
ncbi:helix-turn-helix domain-containing protein [Anaerotignum propionicum]|uniref:helix-turn-helix domain-containing protein n=1 Tax=Anaerotignum propionicum TaxID=28446 RepID=UPI003AB930A8